MRQASFYRAFDHLMAGKGFRSTARSHWARSCGRGATSVFLDLGPLGHDYDVQFGVTYSHRPAPDRLTVFDCVAHGWPDGLTAAQRKSWHQILADPVSSASHADALETLSTLVDVHLSTLRRWEDPRHLYRELHRGRAVQMLVNWRRLIEACKRGMIEEKEPRANRVAGRIASRLPHHLACGSALWRFTLNRGHVILCLMGGALLVVLATCLLVSIVRNGDIITPNPSIAGGGFSPAKMTLAPIMAILGLALIWRGIGRWRNPRPDWQRRDPASTIVLEATAGPRANPILSRHPRHASALAFGHKFMKLKFPAEFTHEIQTSQSREQDRERVAHVAQDLHWREVTESDLAFEFRVGANWKSWGEQITVALQPGKLEIR